MTLWHKSKNFKNLQVKWYSKLKKSGFEDQEHDEEHLKQYSGKTGIKDDQLRSGLTALGETYKYNYYLKAREFLDTFKFKNKTERKMWELHSEGIGIRVIANKLKTYRRKVHETLQRLVKVMNG